MYRFKEVISAIENGIIPNEEDLVNIIVYGQESLEMIEYYFKNTQYQLSSRFFLLLDSRIFQEDVTPDYYDNDLDNEIAEYLANFISEEAQEEAIRFFSKYARLGALKKMVAKGITFTRENFEFALWMTPAENVEAFCDLFEVPLEESFKSIMLDRLSCVPEKDIEYLNSEEQFALEILELYRQKLGDDKAYHLCRKYDLWSDKFTFRTQDFGFKLGELYEQFDQKVDYSGLFRMRLRFAQKLYSMDSDLSEEICHLIHRSKGGKITYLDNFLNKNNHRLEELYQLLEDGLTEEELEELFQLTDKIIRLTN